MIFASETNAKLQNTHLEKDLYASVKFFFINFSRGIETQSRLRLPILVISRDFLPIGHVVHQMLFEHVTPFAHRVQQRLFERSHVHLKPRVKHLNGLQLFDFAVETFEIVNLTRHDKRQNRKHSADKSGDNGINTCSLNWSIVGFTTGGA